MGKCRSTFGDLELWPSRSNSRSKDGERAVDQTYRPNCVLSTSKSAQTTWASVAVLSMTLTFDFQGQIQGQRTGNALETKLTGRIAFFRRQNQRKPRGQVSQYFRWPWPLTYKVKFKFKGRGTRCTPNLQAELRFFTSKSAQTTWAIVAVLSMTLTFDLQGQIQGQRTGNALQTKLTNRIAFFFDVKISANHVGYCRSIFDDHDLWPSRSNSRSKLTST